MNAKQKLGFAGGAAVAAAVLWDIAPSESQTVQRFFKWVERVEKKGKPNPKAR